MKKFFMLMTIAFLCFFTSENSQAKKEPEPFEGNYLRIGYSDITKALQKSEEHFEQTVALPTQIPPVPFTHIFGRLNDSVGNENDELEIKFLHKDLSQNHYSIRIKPIEYRLEIKEKHISRKNKLKDGNVAIFSNMITGFDLLIFEKYGFQYILSVDDKISINITEELLLNIANSIE